MSKITLEYLKAHPLAPIFLVAWPALADAEPQMFDLLWKVWVNANGTASHILTTCEDLDKYARAWAFMTLREGRLTKRFIPILEASLARGLLSQADYDELISAVRKGWLLIAYGSDDKPIWYACLPSRELAYEYVDALLPQFRCVVRPNIPEFADKIRGLPEQLIGRMPHLPDR